MSYLVPTNEPRKTKTSPELSPLLTELLTSSLNADDAIAQIGNDPVLFREAQAALPALKDHATGKAGAAGVKAVIAKRFALFPQADRSDGEWTAWWADYIDALADQPLCALEAGMAAYVRLHDSEFMPKPGKLLELARMTPNRGAQAYTRALKATTGDDPAVERPEPSDAEKAQVRKMLAEFQVKVAVRTVESAKPPQPSIAGKPDAGGLTREMRELMARRSA